MEGFAGSTKKASDDIAAATPAWDVLWRKVGAMPKDALNWATQSDAIDDHMGKVREAIAAKEAAAENEETFEDRVEAAKDAVRRSTEAIAENTQSLEENIAAGEKAAGGVLSLWDAENGHAEALQKANESIKENGKTLDFHTEQGRANRDALADVAKSTYDQIAAMERQGATSAEIQPVIAAQRDEFVKLGIRMGLSADEANGLADKLRLIPGNYQATVNVNNGDANRRIQDTQGLLGMLRDKTIHLSVQETRFIRMETLNYREAGGIVGAAGGGPRSGRTVVGEHGPEILDIAPGSQVHSNPDSMRMLSEMAGQGGGWPTALELRVTGDTSQWLVKAILQAKRDGLLDLLLVP
jgi:hypothetical protein